MSVKTLEGAQSTPSNECHYMTAQGECGQIPLDDLDTFRFKWCQGQYPGGNTYKYTLANPTLELIEEINSKLITNGIVKTDPAGIIGITGNPTSKNYPNYQINIYSKIGPELFQSINCDVMIECSFTWSRNRCYYTVPIENIRSAVLDRLSNEKVFESIEHTQTEYTRTIEVKFKHSYMILPHVSFYMSPFENYGVHIKIVNLTTKSCKFLISYGGNPDVLNIPTDIVFHWSVQGILNDSTTSLIDE
jgi:hypothetical protein